MFGKNIPSLSNMQLAVSSATYEKSVAEKHAEIIEYLKSLTAGEKVKYNKF